MAPRALEQSEVADLMNSDAIGRLATLDSDGYPHVTPIWFHWDGEVVRMTSLENKPHLRRLHDDGRVGFVVDVEDDERSDGERPNRQVRFVGDAVLYEDDIGHWTQVITNKYLTGPGSTSQTRKRSGQPRVVIELRPATTVAVASV